MAELNYDLNNLYRQAFPDLASRVLTRLDGVRDVALGQLDTALGDAFRIPMEAPSPAQLNFAGIEAKLVVQGDVPSWYGSPVFQAITFRRGTYNFLGTGLKQGQVLTKPMGDWLLPHSATAEFRQAKNLTKSSPSGSVGTVKEMWSLEDWDITIRGLILHRLPNVFPEEQVRALLEWSRLADSIRVSGEMFGLLGIDRLVIENLNLGKVAGMPNVVPFQMQCSSDEAVELAILSNRIR
ncbi:DUF6046 domain-containing protein [Hymenobacter sp. IS2118]|uniref:DUF6046 domain-containing protein n=1 Tax=Hymenobacter sp. IS2118 TaxID=1505605 RepID=UPI000555C786|nr:DUF6046 domain-containing protein [Hymenobacter sp. IS2118]